MLYAGEVNWDAAGLEGKARAIEQALKSGDAVLVQVTKDPIGHKGARLTSQISLPGRFLVYVPDGGDDRHQPQAARHRAHPAQGDPARRSSPRTPASSSAPRPRARARRSSTRDVERLQAAVGGDPEQGRAEAASAPALLHGEPDLAIRVVRDIFNEDFTSSSSSQGDDAWETVEQYVGHVAPDLRRAGRAATTGDERPLRRRCRVDEQLAKALDRKVWLPSGGSLVIDRTEAMTVVDVNTGKFIGTGGNLEETVTRNNLEAAEEIVRQLRLRDVGGIIVIDFIDMVLESNRELVLRRLTECLGRDRTKHQVAEVTSLGLVQMTRKRVGEGLLEAFSETVRGLPRPRRHRAHRAGRATSPARPDTAADGGPRRTRRGAGGKSRRRRPDRPRRPAETPRAPTSRPAARGGDRRCRGRTAGGPSRRMPTPPTAAAEAPRTRPPSTRPPMRPTAEVDDAVATPDVDRGRVDVEPEPVPTPSSSRSSADGAGRSAPPGAGGAAASRPAGHRRCAAPASSTWRSACRRRTKYACGGAPSCVGPSRAVA